jgi:hypothetical protein
MESFDRTTHDNPRLIPDTYAFGAVISKLLLLATNTTALARCSRRWRLKERLVGNRSGPRRLPRRRHSREQGDRHAEQNTCIRAVMRRHNRFRRIAPGVQQPEPVNQP